MENVNTKYKTHNIPKKAIYIDYQTPNPDIRRKRFAVFSKTLKI